MGDSCLNDIFVDTRLPFYKARTGNSKTTHRKQRHPLRKRCLQNASCHLVSLFVREAFLIKVSGRQTHPLRGRILAAGFGALALLYRQQLLINNRTRQDDHHGHLKGTQEGHRGAQSASSLGDDSGEVHEDLANLNRPLSSSSCSVSPPQHWQFHSLLGSKWSQIKRTVGKFLTCIMSLPCSLCRVSGTLLIGEMRSLFSSWAFSEVGGVNRSAGTPGDLEF